MARKDVKENLISTGEMKWALQYNLTIPVILHGSVESSKVFISEKNPQQRTPQFGNRGSEGFKSRCFQQALCTSQQKFRTAEI